MFKTKLRIVTEPAFGYKIQYKSFLFWNDFSYQYRFSRLTDAVEAMKKLDKEFNFKSMVVYEQ